MSHLKIWDKFPKTDETYTKQSKDGGRTLTSITPVYMVKLASEVLGAIGVGWGYTIVNERFDNGQPIILIEGNKSQGVLPTYMLDNGAIVWEKTHTVQIEMWIAGSEKTFAQFGHTKYSYMTKTGKYYIDHDYAKKSVTDAMTKCLSLLGVCSDVYMGQFDDVGYKQVAKLEHDLEKANKTDEIYAEKISELKEFVKVQAVQISLCPTIDAMRKVYRIVSGRINREAPIINLDPALEMLPVDNAFHEQEKILKGT